MLDEGAEGMDWQWFAEQLGIMAHDLREQPSVEAALGRITVSATELVEGCDAAGILVVSGHGSVSLVPSEPLVAELDQLQRKLDQGPCLDAVRRAAGGGRSGSPTSPRRIRGGPTS
ncbi:hypothetical protein ACFYX5_32230 [Streptomyces rubiginosohelvolus]|uniref:hypothetical protein n=1 Tax=Streptomyces rubiginosohelvolus TaxID=67362 RepID=UPI003675B712